MLMFELAVVGGLILLNGFFAMSELAIVSARPARLQQLSRGGSRGARAALKLVDDPTGFLSTVQIGITLVGIFAGAYSGATFADPLAGVLSAIPLLSPFADRLAFALVVVGIAFLSLVAGELVPKRLALNNAERIAAGVAPVMVILARIGTPLVWVLRATTEGVLRLLGAGSRPDSTVSEEEIRLLIAEGTEAGIFEPAERRMIEGVLRIADEPARAILVPRTEVVWLDPDDSDEETYRRVHASGHSRYPVGRGSLDDVLGVVHTKDILDQLRHTGSLDLRAIVREPVYVGETMPVLDLLDRFRTAPVHMVVVLDEHGTLEGVVTPMDILKAIAGRLPERAGEDEPDAVRRADGSWLLDGRMPIHSAEDLLGLERMDTGDYETLAGFVLHHLARLPKVGESFEWNGWRFEVVDMDGRRVDRVLAAPVTPDTPA